MIFFMIMHSYLNKMVSGACIIRHILCIIHAKSSWYFTLAYLMVMRSQLSKTEYMAYMIRNTCLSSRILLITPLTPHKNCMTVKESWSRSSYLISCLMLCFDILSNFMKVEVDWLAFLQIQNADKTQDFDKGFIIKIWKIFNFDQ